MATWSDMYNLPQTSEGPGGLSGRGFQWGQTSMTPTPAAQTGFGYPWGPQNPGGNIGTGGFQPWKLPWQTQPVPGGVQPMAPAPEGPVQTPSVSAQPAQDPNTGFAFTPQQGQTVNLPGWDASRMDTDPKQVFGQFAQAWTNSGRPWGADAVRAFVAQDPRWEIDPSSSPNDPRIRVKQDALNAWKPGVSVWQDVIGDAGGQNRVQYMNDPASAAALGFGPGGTATAQPVPASAPNPYTGSQVPSALGMLYGTSYAQPNQASPYQANPFQVAQPGGLNRWMQPYDPTLNGYVG